MSAPASHRSLRTSIGCLLLALGGACGDEATKPSGVVAEVSEDISTVVHVHWNTGEVIADSSWSLESTTGRLRLKNTKSGRYYMYATSTGELKWNTGSTDSSTVWAFERQ